MTYLYIDDHIQKTPSNYGRGEDDFEGTVTFGQNLEGGQIWEVFICGQALKENGMYSLCLNVLIRTKK